MQELLSMKNVTKSFYGNLVLKDGQIEVGDAEIHALIGANGAGKSTMMNILYGILQPDGGTILYNGKEVHFKSIKDAQDAGIFMLHQELNVVKDLTVAQNIFLGREPMKGMALDEERMIEESKALLTEVGLDVHPAVKMGSLSPAKQQLATIAGILSHDLKLLILDEPTTALGDEDVKALFRLMRSFKERGISMIFISHRLDELFTISDRITVMRNGTFIGTYPTTEITKDKLVYYMTGKEVRMQAKEESGVPEDAPIVLEVKDLATEAYLHDVNFNLHKGEVLGFIGLMGSGRTEVARAVCGIDPISGGSISVNGEKVVIESPMDAAGYGIGYLSEDRNEEGLIRGKNIIFNTAVNSLERYAKRMGMDDDAIIDDSMEFNRQVGTVTSDYGNAIEHLSGGNRQKVIIARALMKNLQILIFDEPTRGIDVAAKEEIYEIIARFAAEGHSVIVMSSETDEIRTLCDRVLVMYEGTVEGEIPAGEITSEKIMHYATGMRGDKS